MSTPAGFADAYAGSDLLISLLPTAGNCKARVIDKTMLAREGAYAIWLEPGGIRLLSVRGGQGDKPWVPARETPGADTDQ